VPQRLAVPRAALALAVACAVTCLVVSPLGASSDAAAPRAPVAVRLFRFQPDTLRVSAGTRVVWVNGDEIEHTVTSGAPERADGRFALRLATAGDSAAVVVDRPGTHAYFCERHTSMRGVLIVTPTSPNP
jgi:plastocyanin